jgi:ethanolamine utilization protein EutN
MILAKVVGTVTATIKHPVYHGRALMVLQPVSESGEETGTDILAIDTVQAGVGDLVLALREGTGVGQALGTGRVAVRTVIIGIVDQVTTE